VTDHRIEDLLRECAPQVLGVLTRRYGDFAAAEDATQEALLAAATHWPGGGVPENPRGWLIQTGGRKLLDQRRNEQARRRREELAALREVPSEALEHDDSLTLLRLCCHPALSAPSQIALTLRAVGGLRTAEIARAFLVPEATMAQRISRAKQTIRKAGGFGVDAAAETSYPGVSVQPTQCRGGGGGGAAADDEDDLGSVRRVLYLIFNEGYAASSGADVHRVDLSAEAIRLTRMLPRSAESAGLLALMLLTDARRPARSSPAGDLVPLDEQDRTLWDRARIAEGTAILDAAIGTGPAGEFQLQAAIAALHDRAARAEDTDWPHILALYGLLEQLTGNPVVTLNRAIAAAMVDGPAEGLRLLDGLDERLPGHHRLDATHAHLHERAGDRDTALEYYRSAAARTTSLAERRYLRMRAARLHSAQG
jgi:RNA polymerase sigma factor (sigma-70 family)